MEAQNRRRSKDDRRANHPGRTHEQRTDPSEDPIRRAEGGRPVPRAIENQQLLLHQERFGHDSPQTAGAHQPSQYGEQVNQQNDQVAHREILAASPRITRRDISLRISGQISNSPPTGCSRWRHETSIPKRLPSPLSKLQHFHPPRLRGIAYSPTHATLPTEAPSLCLPWPWPTTDSLGIYVLQPFSAIESC